MKKIEYKEHIFYYPPMAVTEIKFRNNPDCIVTCGKSGFPFTIYNITAKKLKGELLRASRQEKQI